MRDVRVLLLYAPLQFAPGAVPKPDGSLGVAYLAGALRSMPGVEVAVLDCAVGRSPEIFERRATLPSGLVRVGLTDEEILAEAQDYDVIGVTSTFTAQHTMAEQLVRLLATAYPHKPVLVGGVNARHFADRFLAAGAYAVFLSEADLAVVDVIDCWRRSEPVIGEVGIMYGRTLHTGKTRLVIDQLDQLPMPAWDLLPNAIYWAIGRPHGGSFGRPVKYASMMTSRGCPYRCTYCHISVETVGSAAGDIGRFRTKSVERVLRELGQLEQLGVERVYIEDDSLLAKKARAMRIFSAIKDRGLILADVNGVNLSHLYRSGDGLEPDLELLDAMRDAGFEDLSLPFESGSQRIIDKYASSKWSLERMDTLRLISAVRNRFHASGNYMIGYPDESYAEVMATLELARRHADLGLEVNIFMVVPFPGTTLFEYARRFGHLPADWNPDSMWWFNATMQNTVVSPDALKMARDVAWRLLNKPVYVGERVAQEIA